jgi:SAM-dependent methyltransferase
MHDTSYYAMMRFVAVYLRIPGNLRILDVGSMNVNGTYEALFRRPGWTYQGCDTAPGNNVDIVLEKPYDWTGIPSEDYDVVVSGQSFEHIEYIWVTISEIARVLKPGGYCCIIAPSTGPEHKYPYDCWRIYPDGMRTLAKYAGLSVIEATTDWHSRGIWHDSVLIAQKPNYNAGEADLMRARNRLARLTVNDADLREWMKRNPSAY